jgi:hypothetical protein
MPKFVIHIGPAKTGSTYLQSSLFVLRPHMLKDGINYAEYWWIRRPSEIRHAQLLERLQNPPDRYTEEAFQKLRASDFHTVILSCEGFAALPRENLEYWRSLLGDSPVEIVFYCRRWSESIPSGWQQDVKGGRFETFPELWARTLQDPFVRPAVYYTPIWENFCAVFGRESLKLVSYSNLRDRNVDIVTHFRSEILKWRSDIGLPKRHVVRNISPDMFQTETLRCLNYLHFQKTGKMEPRVRDRYLRQEFPLNANDAEASSAAAAALHGQAASQQRVAEAMRQNIAAFTIDDSAAPFDRIYEAISGYRDHLVGPQDGTEIFSRRALEFEWVRPDHLLWPGVLDALRERYAALDLG